MIFKIGDKIVRTKQPTSRIALGKTFEVLGVHKDKVYIKTTTGCMWSHAEFYDKASETEQPEMNTTPKPAPAAAGIQLTTEELEAMLTEARAREQQAAERAELDASLQGAIELAEATKHLLERIRNVRVLGNPQCSRSALLAKYRHELTPLAEVYGCTIVPVGDLSEATVAIAE